MSLAEKYRPKNWSEVVGQDAAIAQIRESINKDGWGGRAWWIVGESGTGCTTIGRLLAKEHADESRVRCVSGVQVETAMVSRMANENPGKEATVVDRAYLIDRPDGMPEEAMNLLTTVLPCLYKNICVVFTLNPGEMTAFCETNVLAKELVPLGQRIELASEGLEEPFARRCKQIAELEGRGKKPITFYRALARRCRFNMRAMLNQI